MIARTALLAACAVAFGAAQAQTKWDMPTPYSDGEFHTPQRQAVRRGREEGDRRQARHHRALQRLAHQAPRHPARGLDRPGQHRRVPARPVRQRGPGVRRRQRAVRRAGLRQRVEVLPGAEAGAREEAAGPRPEAALRGGLARPGHLHQGPAEDRSTDLKGTEVAHLQPAHRAARRAARREPDGGAGARGAADVRHRRDAGDDHLVGHRHLDQGLGVRQELLQDQRLESEERGGGERARLQPPAEGRSRRRSSRPRPPPSRAAGRCPRRARRKATRRWRRTA